MSLLIKQDREDNNQNKKWCVFPLSLTADFFLENSNQVEIRNAKPVDEILYLNNNILILGQELKNY